MPDRIGQQVTKYIDIKLLKGLKNIRIDFKPSGLTAIMGPNGVGKSTILHALACCYKPVDIEKQYNYKFSQFFTPTTDSPWKGSVFSIVHDFTDGPSLHHDVEMTFSKSTDRWSPKYDRRIPRSVTYIGIDTCVPRIEKEKRETFIGFSTSDDLTDELSVKVKQKAGIVMNRDYSHYRINRSKKSTYKGVEYACTRYSELSMGAGEQRIFVILEKVFGAKKNSLILIDEMDLLLHQDALKRMIKVLDERAVEKKLQVIFTTHSPVLLEMEKEVALRHIYPTKEKTLCLVNSKPDIIQSLTGEPYRPLTVFVEDRFAKAIVQEVCHRVEMTPYVAVQEYGAAINVFTASAGLALLGKNIDNCLFILDGDEYVTLESQKERIGKVLTGENEEAVTLRAKIASIIVSFSLNLGTNPETEVIEMIRNNCDLPEDHISRAISAIQSGLDNHDLFERVLKRLGYDEQYDIGCNRIICKAASTSDWERFVRPLNDWLLNKKEGLLL